MSSENNIWICHVRWHCHAAWQLYDDVISRDKNHPDIVTKKKHLTVLSKMISSRMISVSYEFAMSDDIYMPHDNIMTMSCHMTVSGHVTTIWQCHVTWQNHLDIIVTKNKHLTIKYDFIVQASNNTLKMIKKIVDWYAIHSKALTRQLMAIGKKNFWVCWCCCSTSIEWWGCCSLRVSLAPQQS